MADESAKGDVASKKRAAKHPARKNTEHQWPKQQTLLQQRNPAEHCDGVEEQHIAGAIEPSAWSSVCCGSGKNNSARPHHSGY
jgi:hypothetical protein